MAPRGNIELVGAFTQGLATKNLRPGRGAVRPVSPSRPITIAGAPRFVTVAFAREPVAKRGSVQVGRV